MRRKPKRESEKSNKKKKEKEKSSQAKEIAKKMSGGSTNFLYQKLKELIK